MKVLRKSPPGVPSAVALPPLLAFSAPTEDELMPGYTPKVADTSMPSCVVLAVKMKAPGSRPLRTDDESKPLASASPPPGEWPAESALEYV